jgi:cytochrome c nitrite reductase small subunit
MCPEGVLRNAKLLMTIVSEMTRRLGIFIAVMIGIVGGVGAFTFQYAEGFSYFSTDPRACVNCHVMQPHYDSWQKNVHHAWAKCVDCHLPHEGLPKLIAKADNGWRHSKAFTLDDYPDPIKIVPRNAQILQDNCIRCHGEMVGPIAAVHVGTQHDAQANSCVQCHSDVGHGARN